MAQLCIDDSTLIPNHTVKIGRLSNGFTYLLKHNKWPENRFYFYFAQKDGSLQEDNQRGLMSYIIFYSRYLSKSFLLSSDAESCMTIAVLLLWLATTMLYPLSESNGARRRISISTPVPSFFISSPG